MKLMDFVENSAENEIRRCKHLALNVSNICDSRLHSESVGGQLRGRCDRREWHAHERRSVRTHPAEPLAKVGVSHEQQCQQQRHRQRRGRLSEYTECANGTPASSAVRKCTYCHSSSSLRATQFSATFQRIFAFRLAQAHIARCSPFRGPSHTSHPGQRTPKATQKLHPNISVSSEYRRRLAGIQPALSSHPSLINCVCFDWYRCSTSDIQSTTSPFAANIPVPLITTRVEDYQGNANDNDDDIIGEEVRPLPIDGSMDARSRALQALLQDHTYVQNTVR